MKKNKLQINFSNKLLYSFIIIGIITLISVGVYSYGTSTPANFGHTINEIAAPSPCYANQYVQWNGTAWKCSNVTIESSEDMSYFSTIIDAISSISSFGVTWSIASSSGYRYWGVSMSSDGKYQAAAPYFGGYLMLSSNYGGSWATKTTPGSRYWQDTAISSTGQYQTAVVKGGQIYISTDYGNTWTAKDSSRQWSSVSMSADGKYQTAVAGVSYSSSDYIYVSSNYGATWTAKGSQYAWQGVAVSGSGKYQTAITGGQFGGTFVSSDYGQNWVSTSSNIGYDVAISSSGKYQTTMGGTGFFVSSDYGATWTNKLSVSCRGGAAMSASGRYQVVSINQACSSGGSQGGVYVSTDYGATWTKRASAQYWDGIAISAGGKYKTAVTDAGAIYTSVDTTTCG